MPRGVLDLCGLGGSETRRTGTHKQRMCRIKHNVGLQRKEEKEMIRYYIIGVLVLVAIVTVERMFPLAACCAAVTMVLSYVKTSDTY